jgi:hypothetical protein
MTQPGAERPSDRPAFQDADALQDLHARAHLALQKNTDEQVPNIEAGTAI